MVLPITIPATGIRAIPVKGMVRVASTIPMTGTTPHAIASAAHGHDRGASTRRAVVNTATVNIAATASSDHQIEATTAVMMSPARPSCRMARRPARAAAPARPIRATRLAVTVTASRMTRQTATGRPGVMSTRSHELGEAVAPSATAPERGYVVRLRWRDVGAGRGMCAVVRLRWRDAGYRAGNRSGAPFDFRYAGRSGRLDPLRPVIDGPCHRGSRAPARRPESRHPDGWLTRPGRTRPIRT